MLTTRVGFSGRSPRGRRSLDFECELAVHLGSISAWAEEPATDQTERRPSRVDLRVGGGARSHSHIFFQRDGRSPRGRRSPYCLVDFRAEIGSISAWAEEPLKSAAADAAPQVDLRVGGGADGPSRLTTALAGRSPRGRRSHVRMAVAPFGTRSISAWAEEPHCGQHQDQSCRVDLRVGGGASSSTIGFAMPYGRSPRGRRSPRAIANEQVPLGSISAWAEEPSKAVVPQGREGVDLRVGGGARSPPGLVTMCGGRSPRGRRSPTHARRKSVRWGSISAWAEEPRPGRPAISPPRVDLRVGGGARTALWIFEPR